MGDSLPIGFCVQCYTAWYEEEQPLGFPGTSTIQYEFVDAAAIWYHQRDNPYHSLGVTLKWDDNLPDPDWVTEGS